MHTMQVRVPVLACVSPSLQYIYIYFICYSLDSTLWAMFKHRFLVGAMLLCSFMASDLLTLYD